MIHSALPKCEDITSSARSADIITPILAIMLLVSADHTGIRFVLETATADRCNIHLPGAFKSIRKGRGLARARFTSENEGKGDYYRGKLPLLYLSLALVLQPPTHGRRRALNCSSINLKSVSPRNCACTLPWLSIRMVNGRPRTPPYSCPSFSSP